MKKQNEHNVTHFLFGFFVLGTLASFLIPYIAYTYVPVKYFAQLKSIEVYVKDGKVFDSTLYRTVRQDITADVHREFFCTQPDRFPLGNINAARPFPIEKYDVVLTDQGEIAKEEDGNTMLREKVKSNSELDIPAAWLKRDCTRFYAVYDYDIIFPNGHRRPLGTLVSEVADFPGNQTEEAETAESNSKTTVTTNTKTQTEVTQPKATPAPKQETQSQGKSESKSEAKAEVKNEDKKEATNDEDTRGFAEKILGNPFGIFK